MRREDGMKPSSNIDKNLYHDLLSGSIKKGINREGDKRIGRV